MIKALPFADWTPDLPDLGGTGITAKNVMPWAVGYKSFPALVQTTSALNARCQGAYFARDSASNVYNFAGTSTKLYSLATATYNDVSRTAGGAYATASDDSWEFLQWGQTVIATNYADAPQVITLGSANFAALGGTPPKARHIASIRDFVVLGNTNDGTQVPNRVQWSGINNSASWTVSAATQSDYQDLQGDGGWVQRIVGGEFGLVFQERAIWRMTYVGSPVIFQFDMIEKARGTPFPNSVIGWGNMVFFIADDGFYVIVGGAPAIPIGDGKVDRYFLNDYQSGGAVYSRVSAAIDPVNKLVMWAYPGSGSSGGTPNRILAYNWVYKKWSLIEQTMEMFARYASPGYTLEGLDSLSSSIDALTSSLDSRAYTGGAMSLAAFDSSHKLGTFTGTAMAAQVDTGEIQLSPESRSYVRSIRPLIDGNVATISTRYRDLLSDTTTVGTGVSQNSYGICPMDIDSRFFSFRAETTGAFKFIQGVEVEFEPSSVY